jgi:hypothetical protein
MTYDAAISDLSGNGTVIVTALAGGAVDAAGNGNAASTSTDNTVTLDATLPGISTPVLAAGSDSGASSTDNITSVTTPTFTGTATAGADVKLYEGIRLLGTATATGGAWTIASRALAEGVHNVLARANELIGGSRGHDRHVRSDGDNHAGARSSCQQRDRFSHRRRVIHRRIHRVRRLAGRFRPDPGRHFGRYHQQRLRVRFPLHDHGRSH